METGEGGREKEWDGGEGDNLAQIFSPPPSFPFLLSSPEKV